TGGKRHGGTSRTGNDQQPVADAQHTSTSESAGRVGGSERGFDRGSRVIESRRGWLKVQSDRAGAADRNVQLRRRAQTCECAEIGSEETGNACGRPFPLAQIETHNIGDGDLLATAGAIRNKDREALVLAIISIAV